MASYLQMGEICLNFANLVKNSQKHEVSRLRNIFLMLSALLLICGIADAQRRERVRNVKKNNSGLVVPIFKDTTKEIIPDSVLVKMDSIRKADSVARVDSAELMKHSSLEFPAFSEAKDSLKEVFRDGHQILYYYGDVSVNYGTMKLTADYMEYDVQSQTVYARGTEDPLTGETKGNPVMDDNGKSYEMKELTYNFKTRKAFVKNMVTNESEGILRGKNIKMMPDQSINITNGKYTVCDCEEPHYYLHLTAAKVMTKPTQNTVFGPAWPVVEGVPLFPVVLPFGFIPKRPERATGLLMPTFGEEAARGFYLRDMGMYFVIGDYFDMSITGDYFTLGSWAVNFNSRYMLKYKFTGNISINYSYDQVGEKGEPDCTSSANFGVRWSHQQDSKAHPGASFSASVNFSSPQNSRYNARSVTEALNNQTSSSISYSRNWNGKFNLSINALHSQNTRDSSYAFTLPNLTFSVSKFYPFKRKVRVGKERFYEKFSLSYNTAFQNSINFRAPEFGQPGFLDKMKNSMSHNFSIGLPNFTILKYINVNPSVSYAMNWLFDSTEKVYNPETDKVEDVRGGTFSTFGATHTYGGSISMDTQIYGMYNFGKHNKIQAVRHIIKPSLSMNFSPDQKTYFNGWRTLEYTDAKGDFKSLDYNIYSSAPSGGKTAAASLVIGNNLEAKVRDLRDTTGVGSKKVKLLDQLNLSTNYNFLADSLNMSDVNLTFSTNVLGKIGINGSVLFDPYAVNEYGQKVNKYNVAQTGHLLRFKQTSLSMSYALNGKGTIDGNDGSKSAEGGGQTASKSSSLPTYTRIYYHPVTGEYIPGGWIYYMNPNAPWSVNFSYSLGYRKDYRYNTAESRLETINDLTQTLNISGNIKITPALSINASSGVDLKAFKLTTTQISATYDLHCFNIQFSWVPSGKWKSWNFTIAANAAALSDLLRLRKSNSFWDNQ